MRTLRIAQSFVRQKELPAVLFKIQANVWTRTRKRKEREMGERVMFNGVEDQQAPHKSRRPVLALPSCVVPHVPHSVRTVANFDSRPTAGDILIKIEKMAWWAETNRGERRESRHSGKIGQCLLSVRAIEWEMQTHYFAERTRPLCRIDHQRENSAVCQGAISQWIRNLQWTLKNTPTPYLHRCLGII